MVHSAGQGRSDCVGDADDVLFVLDLKANAGFRDDHQVIIEELESVRKALEEGKKI